MPFTDDDLLHLEAHGLPPLPPYSSSGFVAHDGASIWFADWGTGPAVVLLHGGLGNAGNWSHQVPVLVDAGYRVIALDSRGQGRSSRDARSYSYDQMADDTCAVLDRLGVADAAFVGWSDGADTSLVLARKAPQRVRGVFFFACNVDATGALPFAPTPRIDRIYNYHVRQYAALSPTPAEFERMRDELGVMQATQPNYGPDELAEIDVPVWSVIGEGDEFIRRDHAEYIAGALPRGRFVLIPEVSHFAPIQRPATFTGLILDFLAAVSPHHAD